MKEAKGHGEATKKIQHNLTGVKQEEEKEWKSGNICRNKTENFPEVIKDMTLQIQKAQTLTSKMGGRQKGQGQGGNHIQIDRETPASKTKRNPKSCQRKKADDLQRSRDYTDS